MIANNFHEFVEKSVNAVAAVLNSDLGQELTQKLLEMKLAQNPHMTADEWSKVKQGFMVFVFEEAMKSREDIRNRAKSAISQVERRKREDIAKAEAGKAAQEIYSQFDESRISTDIDRVLNQFSDYADEQEKMGMGAKASWETSYEAKKIAAEKRENEYLTDEYIESLLGNETSK